MLLDDETQALLYQALQEEPPEGGFWNGRKVADWLSERLGRPVHRQRGWEILKQMEFSLKVPRPEHQYAATEAEQRVWEKKLWWLLPRVNIDLFNRALADFAQHFDLGPHRQVLLVIDQAAWHTSEQVVVPEGLHLAFLPPYSPHMQPAERLWPILNEALANRVFNTLDDLLDRVEQRCRQLLNLTDLISGLTQFHWWEAFQC